MSQPAGPPDAELVAAVLGGDRQAFAEVYDRYADRLHDFAHSMLRNPEEAADAVADSFVAMAEKLGQLRDPDRLRPWLYSVVRRECLRRLRGRSRVAYDGDERLTEMSDDARGPEREAEVAAMRTLVWDAAAGLGDRDRVLLDLHLRQGLEGAELAEAAGITAGNAYTSLNRLRAQVERSLGALLIARLGRDECPDLSAVLASWDGRFSPLVRKRVARHVDDCDVCGRRRSAMVSPVALLAGVPLLPAPAVLRDRVLGDARMVSALAAHEAGTGASGGGSGGGGAATDAVRRRRAAVAASAGAVAVGVVAGLLLVLPDREPALTDAAVPAPADSSATSSPPSTASSSTAPTGPASPAPAGPAASAPPTPADTTSPPTAAAPAELVVAARTIEIPFGATSAGTTLSNAGGQPLAYTVAVLSGSEWLGASPVSGSLPAGGSAPLAATATRASMPASSDSEPTTGQLLVSWGGGPPVAITVVAPPRYVRVPEGSVPSTVPSSGPPQRDPADQPTGRPTGQPPRPDADPSSPQP